MRRRRPASTGTACSSRRNSQPTTVALPVDTSTISWYSIRQTIRWVLPNLLLRFSPTEHGRPTSRLVPTLDSNLALDLVRTTEAAALAAALWVGRGDKIAADQAAVDGMRLIFNVVHMDGIVVIGEGEKDQAPMLYNGERLGTGNPPVVDVAVDPIDGTRLVARGEANALSVVAVAERGAMFNPGPCVYMEKIATGREAGGGDRHHGADRDEHQDRGPGQGPGGQ